MSIRLIDEIYSALHNGEKPPYTNARGLKDKYEVVFGKGYALIPYDLIDLGYIDYNEFKFKNYFKLPIIENSKYILPPIVD